MATTSSTRPSTWAPPRSSASACPSTFRDGVTYVRVQDSQQALALLACNFHGNPSRELKLVGITGTNGKTSTATLLYRLFRALGYKCGLISTVEIRIGTRTIDEHAHHARTPCA